MSQNNPMEEDHFQPTRGGSLGFDPASMLVWAEFMAAAIGNGIIGAAAFEFLKQWRQRHGKPGVDHLRGEILKALKKVKRKPGVSHEDLELRVDEIMKKHESLWRG